MKKIFFITLILNFSIINAQTPCSGGSAGSYPCDGLDLQSYFSLSQLGATSGNDSWGWTDPLDGKEYAIVGLNNSTFFIDITDPVNPRRLGRLMSHNNSSTLWRDVKTYNNHAFIVSEASGHGMQVFDLTRLRGLTTNANRTFTADAHYGNFGDAHNIIINEDTGIAYVLGANIYSGGPHFINITNPTSPVSMGGYNGKGYTHDAQVVIYDGPDPDHQGREIFIGSNEDEVVILDVTNKSSVQVISTITYSNFRYTHQGWFTEDKRYFLLGDEEDEAMAGIGNTRTIVLDLIDLDNPSIHFYHAGTTAAIDHNGYVRGNRFYMASYSAGVRILKVDDIENQNLTEVSYFDTYPSTNSASFNGAWNIYPFFESGNLIVSNYNTGFFIVKDPNYDNVDPVIVCQNITATLDKTTGTVTVNPIDLDGGSTDNFGIVNRSITGQTTFTCDDVGESFDVTYTVEDDYGNSASCVATITVAAETTSYLGAGVWSNGTPEVGSNAKISTNYNTSAIGNGSIDACTCEVDASSTLTIAADDYLNITKDIAVNGTLIVEHEGIVVQTDPDASVVNNGTINVELTTPVLQNRDFMIMGSPMTSEIRNGVFTNAFLVLNHDPSNFIPHPGVPAGGTNFADNNGDFWTTYNGAINVGEGYIVRPQSGYTDPANITYDMTYSMGTLNNGDVTRNITYNGAGSNPDGTPNVLANPYASPISADALIAGNSVIDRVYFWEHLTPPSTSIPGYGSLNFSMDDISMYIPGGALPAANDPGTSTTPNGIISTGQGFAIKAFAGGVGNEVTFTNAMRLTSGNNTLRIPEEGVEKIMLKVRSNDYNIGSHALVGFNPQASEGMDELYDADRLATTISLYSHLDDGTGQLGIQNRGAFDPAIKIPMGFASQVEANASFTISIASIEGEVLPNSTVFLIDNIANTVTNLNTTNYTFTSGKGVFNSRFTLQFVVDSILGPLDNLFNSISIYPNPTKEFLTISSPLAYISNLEVHDIRGRRIAETIEGKKNNYTLDLSSLNTGIYFVKIETDLGTVTKKVIKD
ncbi:choice-of-anchor B family protein [Constantimarinum furrinae]|uniref:HYR domain-containing protein n=1 Tax=Constantimarinum furrinae TaxID=2562285 RepID=A0A7G8PUD0_9FLAO|nr:choice-of-anchor B family protein [Constantimarinum furrinae]QNJ97946.1 hypothetical protein ALE3EI_1384 [Constantimarinum furrinae]